LNRIRGKNGKDESERKEETINMAQNRMRKDRR